MKKVFIFLSSLLFVGVAYTQINPPAHTVNTIPKTCGIAVPGNQVQYCDSKLTDNGTALMYNGSPVGGASAVTQIQNITVSSNTTAVTFSSIPQTYKHLKLIWGGASVANGGTTSALVFNGVVTGYVAKNITANINDAFLGFGGGFSQPSVIVGGSYGEATIDGYTGNQTQVQGMGGTIGTLGMVIGMGGGTAGPVTSISLSFTNTVQWSSGTFTLYGYN